MLGPNGELYLDNSMASSLAACDTRAFLRYVHGYTTEGERAILHSGTAGHEALAVFFQTGNIEEALDKLDSLYKDFSLKNVPDDDRLSWRNLRDIVKHWMETRKGKLPFMVEAADRVEIGFACPVDEAGSVILTGRMDLQARGLQDGAAIVVDHKFTGRINPMWVKKWKLDSQMSGYIFAAQTYFPDVTGAYINAIELSKLPSTEGRKCRVHSVPYSECRLHHLNAQIIGPIQRSPEQIENWRGTFLALAEKYRRMLKAYPTVQSLAKVRMQGMFSNSCTYCDFQDFCSLGKPLKHLKTMLVHQPWEPYKVAFGEEEK
jgi:hypothetical protein